MKHKKSIKDIRKENYDVEKILRDIRTLSEPEEDYYKPIKILNAFDDNLLNMKVMVKKAKHYQLRNILIRLNHI